MWWRNYLLGDFTVKEIVTLLLVCAIVCMARAQGVGQDQKSSGEGKEEFYPWIGKYPDTIFPRARTSNVVEKGRVTVGLNIQHFDWDLVRGADGDYHKRPSTDTKRKLTTVLCTKYGWAEGHHVALGIPYLFNDFDVKGKTNDSDGLGNIYVFEKWNALKETNMIPGVALDAWVYFPTGDENRKLGDKDWAFKLTTEISKAWKHFSIHFNPGYTWGEDDDVETGEINAAVIWNLHKDFLPAVEYNYLDKEDLGTCEDIVPGFIWKFAKDWSFKLGVVINIDTTLTDRDRVGVIIKFWHKL